MEEAVRPFELFFVKSLSAKALRIGSLPFCHCVRFSTVCAELEKLPTLVHSFDLRRKRHGQKKSPRFSTEYPQSDCSGHGYWFDNLSQSISSRSTDSEHFCRQGPPFYGPRHSLSRAGSALAPSLGRDAQGSQRKPGPHRTHSLSTLCSPPPAHCRIQVSWLFLTSNSLWNISCRTEIDPIGCFLAHIHLLTLPLQDLASLIV